MKSSVALRFFVVLILLLPYYKDVKAQSPSCDDIKVSVEVTPTSGGQSNGKIKLTLSEDLSSYRIHLFESGRSYKLNINKTEIENLPKGVYLLVLTGKTENSKFCPKNIEVNIK